MLSTKIIETFTALTNSTNKLRDDIKSLESEVKSFSKHSASNTFTNSPEGSEYIRQKLLPECSEIAKDLSLLSHNLPKSSQFYKDVEEVTDEMEVQIRMICAYMAEYGFNDPYNVKIPTFNPKTIDDDFEFSKYDSSDTPRASRYSKGSESSQASSTAIPHIQPTELEDPPSPSLEISDFAQQLLGGVGTGSPSTIGRPSGLDRLSYNGSDIAKSLTAPSISTPASNRYSIASAGAKSNFTNTPPVPNFTTNAAYTPPTSYYNPLSDAGHTPPVIHRNHSNEVYTPTSPQFGQRSSFVTPISQKFPYEYQNMSASSGSIGSAGSGSKNLRTSDSLLGQLLPRLTAIEFASLPDYLKAQLSLNSVDQIIEEINDLVTDKRLNSGMVNDTDVFSLDELISIVKTGVRLSYLKVFIAENGGRGVFEGLTTKDVSDRFIFRQTFRSKQSLCEQLAANRKGHYVGDSNWFISHAWQYKFLDLVDAIFLFFNETPDGVITLNRPENFGKRPEKRRSMNPCICGDEDSPSRATYEQIPLNDPILWIDLFSNSQHFAPDRSSQWWATTFYNAINQIHQTLVVMLPWDDPVILTRAWCIYEIYVSTVTNSRFEVTMTESENQRFLTTMRDDPLKFFNILARVKSESSIAFHEQDRNGIHRAIRSSIGFRDLDAMLGTVFRQWTIRTLKYQISASHADGRNQLRELDWIHSLARLYSNQGQLDKAEPLFEDCLKRRTALLSEEHKSTLTTLHYYAALSMKQGKFEKSKILNQMCLALRSTNFGEYHLDTLMTMMNLAALHDQLGEFNLAEELYKKCLVVAKMRLGPSHYDTLRLTNAIATLCINQGRYFEAKQYYEECLNNQIVALGEDHLDTISTFNNLATLYERMGNMEVARVMYADCFNRLTRILGPTNPNTMAAYQNMTNLSKRISSSGMYPPPMQQTATPMMFNPIMDQRTVLIGDFPHDDSGSGYSRAHEPILQDFPQITNDVDSSTPKTAIIHHEFSDQQLNNVRQLESPRITDINEISQRMRKLGENFSEDSAYVKPTIDDEIQSPSSDDDPSRPLSTSSNQNLI
ncbi:Kinesin light chain 3 [Nowakowskiella sp. JEL0407]|nr:Kinesin light chain 3 [Nowakowskiella sp. JEL0407]